MEPNDHLFIVENTWKQRGIKGIAAENPFDEMSSDYEDTPAP